MEQFVTETSISNGRLELNNIPFSNNVAVKIIIIPKVDLSSMSWAYVQFRGSEFHTRNA